MSAEPDNPIAQLEIVLASRRNRCAALVGSIGGLIPYSAYEVGHHEVTSWTSDPKAGIVYACLAFSVLTTVDFSHQVFRTASASRWSRALSWVKALGFTAGVEAVMMTSDNTWLSTGCLALLIAINAVANGCRLAVRSAVATATVTIESVSASPAPMRRARYVAIEVTRSRTPDLETAS